MNFIYLLLILIVFVDSKPSKNENIEYLMRNLNSNAKKAFKKARNSLSKASKWTKGIKNGMKKIMKERKRQALMAFSGLQLGSTPPSAAAPAATGALPKGIVVPNTEYGSALKITGDTVKWLTDAEKEVDKVS
jgi:hypothetical protein